MTKAVLLAPRATSTAAAAILNMSTPMQPASALSLATAGRRLSGPGAAPSLMRRTYATQHSLGATGAASSGPRRKSVTPFNDDGHVPWSELSAGEKAARATQQTFNFGLILVGIVLTGGVSYFLYTEVFSTDSKVSYFNRAVDRIRKDPRCLELLGDGKKISAFGEETWNKWRRARPISSQTAKDAQGNEHIMIRFNVEGPLNRGLVNIQLTKRAGEQDFEYKFFYLDVPGHPRVYLENSETAKTTQEKSAFRMFGVSWR